MTADLPTRATHAAWSTHEWWRHSVIYQIYPRSFADANGDGLGDLPGITSRLRYLHDLGVDAVWLSPFYPSPQADGGYDVANYCDVDPRFGTLADMDTLISAAHELGVRVMIDIVPNHSSDEHPWFQQALAAGPGSPERGRYLFRRGVDGGPPNNWQSPFGGSAWTQVPDGEWYLHLFDVKQPDFNWDDADVRAMFLDVLRFWLDRGVDGFRVDVAHGLAKDPALPDWTDPGHAPEQNQDPAPMWDQDRVVEIFRAWRQVLDTYPGDRAMVAEAWVTPMHRLARYIRADVFQQAFNFAFLQAPWTATALRSVIAESLRASDAVGAPTTWVLSNHDVVRHASRLGLPRAPSPRGLRPDDPQPDLELGLRRARAATTLMLGLPGSSYLYQGEELGLPEVIDLPPAARQDPTFFGSNGKYLGRDGCRVPLPWQKHAPSYGFGPSAQSWLPQPAVFGDLAADQQTGRPESTLELYRRILAVRAERGMGNGSLTEVDLGPDLIAYEITSARATTRVVVNLGEQEWPIPAQSHVLVSSEPGIDDKLGPDQAVWLA